MKLIDDEELLARVETFLTETGMAPTRFGREVMGEASLVARLKDGRSLSLKNANKVMDFITSYVSDADETAPAEPSAQEAA